MCSSEFGIGEFPNRLQGIHTVERVGNVVVFVHLHFPCDVATTTVAADLTLRSVSKRSFGSQPVHRRISTLGLNQDVFTLITSPPRTPSAGRAASPCSLRRIYAFRTTRSTFYHASMFV
ncbi:hypothetical protein PsYK624_142280 [Phanerochaete sordida]|uniref:Uncharacterized protein n=1 Tax=Phanerochaete sordida TaxID=48140 RepID=A0A9P3LJZ3_9APHY|nr:hypothetical protein PsYK624_142280 [Phanerochaete sordida]